MTRQIDLGHSLFQTTGSPLQLQFSATAKFTQVATGSNPRSMIKFSHWKDLQSLWITEAPELDLRIFVSIDHVVEAAGPTFVTSLEEGLCNSKVWTDLGFDIILKSRPNFVDSIAPGTYCLTFGLCRRGTLHASTNSKRIPPILQNPPEAHTPSDVPTACLASLDLHLRYASCDAMQQLETQIMETLYYKSRDGTESEHNSCSMHFTHSTGKIAVATYSPSTMEGLLLPFDQHFNADGSTDVDPTRQTTKVDELSLQFLDLFDFGLQKLILAGVIRSHHIKVVGKNKLQNMSLLAPAIFNLEYREAMKQRAATLSTISRSLMPMLDHSNNPVLQSKLSTILRKSTDGEESLTSEIPQESPLTKSLKSTIESSLWSIAQHQLSKTKAIKTSAPFFEQNCPSRKPSIQSDNDIILPATPEQDFDFDSEILELDDDTHLPPNLNHSRVSDELLSDGSSILTFQDLHESTQTTKIIQTTQPSIENFSQAFNCQPRSWDDMDILLSDEILMDEGFGEYEDFEDMILDT